MLLCKTQICVGIRKEPLPDQMGTGNGSFRVLLFSATNLVSLL